LLSVSLSTAVVREAEGLPIWDAQASLDEVGLVACVLPDEAPRSQQQHW